VLGFDWMSLPAALIYLGSLAAAVLAILTLGGKLWPRRREVGQPRFERRRLVYEQMFAVVYEWRDRIEAAADAAEKGGPDEELVTPGPEEERRKWVLMRARLQSGGSRPVADAFERVVEAVVSLWKQVTRVRDIRKQGGGSLNEAREAMRAARDEVKSSMKALEDLVGSELEKL
jgi:hypothetical protein